MTLEALSVIDNHIYFVAIDSFNNFSFNLISNSTQYRTCILMRMMCYSVMTQAYSEKEIPSSPNRSRTYDLPITSSDALPLSYRRLVGAKAIKLGSWDKHPAYC